MLTFDQSIGTCCDAKVMSGMNTIFFQQELLPLKYSLMFFQNQLENTSTLMELQGIHFRTKIQSYLLS